MQKSIIFFVAAFLLSFSSLGALGDSNSLVEVSYVQFKDTNNSSVPFKSGNTVELIVSLNAVAHNLFNVSASISATDPCINFTRDNSSYGNLIVSNSVENTNNPFVFTIASDCEVKSKDFKLTVIGSAGFHQELSFSWNEEGGTQTTRSVSKDLDLSTSSADNHESLKTVPIVAEEPENSDEVIVNAGPFQTVTLPSKAILKGTTSLDEKHGIKVYMWCKVIGPGIVTYANPYSLITTASFQREGAYELLLTAIDKDTGQSGNSKVFIKVNKDDKKDSFLNIF